MNSEFEVPAIPADYHGQVSSEMAIWGITLWLFNIAMI